MEGSGSHIKHYAATQSPPPFGIPGGPQRGRYGFTATQKSDVYDAIHRAGKGGITRADIAAKVGLRPDRISFYLSDLRRAGHIEVVGDQNPYVVTPQMNAREAAFAAMLALESALVTAAREQGAPTPEQEKAFVKYNKIKELALRPGTGPEGRTALRMALLELVRVVV